MTFKWIKEKSTKLEKDSIIDIKFFFLNIQGNGCRQSHTCKMPGLWNSLYCTANWRKKEKKEKKKKEKKKKKLKNQISNVIQKKKKKIYKWLIF